MAVSDGEVVFAVVGYFAILTILLATFGIGGPSVFVPDATTVAEASGQDPSAIQATSGILCAGSIGLAFFTVGLSLVASAVSCSAFAFSVFAPDASVSAFTYVFAFMAMFFQVVSFQLPVHPAINAIMVMPPGAALVYLGIRVLRGGG